jgi:hypothetical protein
MAGPLSEDGKTLLEIEKKQRAIGLIRDLRSNGYDVFSPSGTSVPGSMWRLVMTIWFPQLM